MASAAGQDKTGGGRRGCISLDPVLVASMQVENDIIKLSDEEKEEEEEDDDDDE